VHNTRICSAMFPKFCHETPTEAQVGNPDARVSLSCHLPSRCVPRPLPWHPRAR
jgi:hypothetical protein